MNHIKKQMQMAKKRGMNNVDLLRMREIAKQEAKKMELEATEKAFLYMMAIPLNVLASDYWSKTAKKQKSVRQNSLKKSQAYMKA